MSLKSEAAEAVAASSKAVAAGGKIDVSNDYSKWDRWAVDVDGSDDEDKNNADEKSEKKEKKYNGPKYSPPKILPPTTNPTSVHFFYGIDGRIEHPAVDVCGDGSVMKVITREGMGPKDWLPIEGDKCNVHYIGILEDGTKFDSSRDHDEPFSFRIGHGVIDGWSEGVATMRQGEVAEFVIAPEKAYGKGGKKSPDTAVEVIPPNTTLKFEVELLNIRINDISKARDGGIAKKMKRKGEGWAAGEQLDTVTFNYRLSLKDSAVVVDEGSDITAVVDEAFDGIPALAQIIANMKRLEKATFLIQPKYGFGEAGNADKGVPPNAALTADVEVTHIERMDMGITGNDKVQVAERVKVIGNAQFGAKDFDRAIKRYKKALSVIASDYSFAETEDLAAAVKLRATLNANLGACFLKKKNYAKVIEHCEQTLATAPRNAKALCRIGIAQMYQDQWTESESNLKKALALDANNKTAKKNLKKLRLRVNKQNKKDTMRFKRVFETGLTTAKTRSQRSLADKGKGPSNDDVDPDERKKAEIVSIMKDTNLTPAEKAAKTTEVLGPGLAPEPKGTPDWQANFMKMLQNPNISAAERQHHIAELRRTRPEWFGKDGTARPPQQRSADILKGALTTAFADAKS